MGPRTQIRGLFVVALNRRASGTGQIMAEEEVGSG
jgi:hypothetical protein